MTSEQRVYLKCAIDAHKRAALTAAGDRKFRQPPQPDPFSFMATAIGVAGVVVLVLMIVLLAYVAAA